MSADASIAAFSDYPDEDIEGLDYDNFLKMLSSAKLEIEQMLSTYDRRMVENKQELLEMFPLFEEGADIRWDEEAK